MEFTKDSHKWENVINLNFLLLSRKNGINLNFFNPGANQEYKKNSDFENFPDIESTRNKSDIISFQMYPSRILRFNSLLVHG